MPAAEKSTKTTKTTKGKKVRESKKATNPKEAVVKAKSRKIVYPDWDIVKYDNASDKPLREKDAHELLGWKEVTEKTKEFLFIDKTGKKIFCEHNNTNRPFTPGLANDWMLEILKRRWKVNGEYITIDRVGDVQDGQHRLIGLSWACQEYRKDPAKWPEWDEEPYIETAVTFGIMEDDETVNTIGVAKPRSTTDVIFRSEVFRDLKARERKDVSRMMAYALKLVIKRTAANLNADPMFCVGRRSHTDTLAFLQRHMRLVDCIRHIREENVDRAISKHVPPGTAAGLLYLMGSSASEQDTYIEVSSEEGIDWKLWDKACEFWVELAKGPSLKVLRHKLIGLDSTGFVGAQEKIATVVKAWNAWSDGDKVDEKTITVLMTTNEVDEVTLAECPICGGIDFGDETINGDTD